MTSPHLWSSSQFVRIHFLSSVVICLYAYVIKPFVPEKSKETLAGSRTISSFSGYSFPDVILMPLSSISYRSFDVAVAITNTISTTVCAATCVTTSLIMSAKLDVSRKPFFLDLLNEPNRKKKKKKECSGSFSVSLSHDEMLAEFQCFMASGSTAGHFFFFVIPFVFGIHEDESPACSLLLLTLWLRPRTPPFMILGRRNSRSLL